MRSRRALLVAGGLAAGLVACNLIAGFESEYSVVGAVGEAGTDGSTDSDGAVDGSQPPDSAITDAGSDARFCALVDAFFCDDFEDGGLMLRYEKLNADASAADASVIVDPTAGRDGTGGLRVTLYEGTQPALPGVVAYVEKTIASGDPGAFLDYEVEFDFRNVDRGAVDYYALGIVTFPNGGSDREHGVATYAPNTVSKLHPPGDNIVADGNAWHHARIRLSRPAGAAKLDRIIQLDDQLPDGGYADQSTGYSFPTTGGTVVRIGIFNTGAGTGAVHATFDNLVIRRR